MAKSGDRKRPSDGSMDPTLVAIGDLAEERRRPDEGSRAPLVVMASLVVVVAGVFWLLSAKSAKPQVAAPAPAPTVAPAPPARANSSRGTRSTPAPAPVAAPPPAAAAAQPSKPVAAAPQVAAAPERRRPIRRRVKRHAQKAVALPKLPAPPPAPRDP